jgi:hypothetical protein
MDVVTQLEQS